jgi:hypothetical protein
MRRWLPLLAVGVLLGAAMLAAAFANPPIQERPAAPRSLVAPPPQTMQAQETAPPPLSTVSAPVVIPGWITWLVMVLCTALVVTIIALFIWYYVRDRLPDPPRAPVVETAPLPTPGQTRRRLREALDEGIAELDDSDADPRRAVIACWVRLESAAAAAGTPREAGDTSTDFVTRLLQDHHVSADLLTAFAAVYRGARFAPHEVDAGMRDQARAALRRLRDELDRRAEPDPAPAGSGPVGSGPVGPGQGGSS